MTKLILVSATTFEIEPLLHFLQPYKSNSPGTFVFGRLTITSCITGVGMTNTAFELGKKVNEPFDLAVNLGIAGSFTHYKPGDVVNVTNDRFSELGAQDDTAFISVDELGFGKQCVEVFNLLESPRIRALPKASGITVNQVHGHEESIREVTRRLEPEVESMEGAAFIHAANTFNWRAAQIRCISNKVEKRNKANWDMPLAIKNLNAFAIELIRELNFDA